MKSIVCKIMQLVCIALVAASCDEGLKPAAVTTVQDLLHPESGKEKMTDAKLGYFYENDYIAPMFNPFKTKEEYDAIRKEQTAKFLHVAADTSNTVDIVTALAEYEDLSFRDRIKASSDLRYQMIYVNTYPSDAKYDLIDLKSSDENVLNPIMINPKTWFVEFVDKGSADLTLTVSDGKNVIRKVYPMCIIAAVPMFFSCDNVWFYGGTEVPIQKITLKYSFPKLPKAMNKLDFLASARVKCYRRCKYRDEPNYGNRWFTVEDTVSFGPDRFVEALESEKEKSFMTVRGNRFDPYWEWDRYYTEYLDTVKNEVVRVLHEKKVPYEIYRLYLYFDETPFCRYFDMDGAIGETNFMAFEAGWRTDPAVMEFYDSEYCYVDMHYRRMGYLWNPEKAEHNILELFFNEFLTDEEIGSLLGSMANEYYSHGWNDYQVDSIFNANYQYLQGYRRDGDQNL